MRVRHDCEARWHEVFLGDDGTMDTVITVDGHELRFSEADRHADGSVKVSWLREAAREACQDGMLQEEPDPDAEPPY